MNWRETYHAYFVKILKFFWQPIVIISWHICGALHYCPLHDLGHISWSSTKHQMLGVVLAVGSQLIYSLNFVMLNDPVSDGLADTALLHSLECSSVVFQETSYIFVHFIVFSTTSFPLWLNNRFVLRDFLLVLQKHSVCGLISYFVRTSPFYISSRIFFVHRENCFCFIFSFIMLCTQKTLLRNEIMGVTFNGHKIRSVIETALKQCACGLYPFLQYNVTSRVTHNRAKSAVCTHSSHFSRNHR
jgi:hypothetical protein